MSKNISMALHYREALRRTMPTEELKEMCLPFFSSPGGNRVYTDRTDSDAFATYVSDRDPPTSVMDLAHLGPTRAFILMLEFLEGGTKYVVHMKLEDLDTDLRYDLNHVGSRRARALFNYYGRISPYHGFVLCSSDIFARIPSDPVVSNVDIVRY